MYPIQVFPLSHNSGPESVPSLDSELERQESYFTRIEVSERGCCDRNSKMASGRAADLKLRRLDEPMLVSKHSSPLNHWIINGSQPKRCSETILMRYLGYLIGLELQELEFSFKAFLCMRSFVFGKLLRTERWQEASGGPQ